MMLLWINLKNLKENKVDFILESNNWELDEKRFESRNRYYDRMEYRCSIYNTKGLLTKCNHKNCAYCSYFWKKESNKISIDYLSEEYDYEFESQSESPIKYVNRIELHEIIEDAIASLPTKEARLITRMISFSYSFSEIGEVLGISKVAVFRKRQMAKQILKSKLLKSFK